MGVEWQLHSCIQSLGLKSLICTDEAIPIFLNIPEFSLVLRNSLGPLIENDIKLSEIGLTP
ncbi:MAG: hypothetical protein BGO12_13750 [Verrucomicrobia bacterium 61-8]|nr:MAG: hypothetical protein BGO12_13750 [Verrucomicrobia bacterium 61-8]